jgi:hypothetical protein
MSWLFAPFAILLGVVLATQVATNALSGKRSATTTSRPPSIWRLAYGSDLVADFGVAFARDGARCAMVRLACRRLDGDHLPYRKYSSRPTARSRRIGRPHRRRSVDFLGSARPFRLDRFCAAFRQLASSGGLRAHDCRRFSDREVLGGIAQVAATPGVHRHQAGASRQIRCPSGSCGNAPHSFCSRN